MDLTCHNVPFADLEVSAPSVFGVNQTVVAICRAIQPMDAIELTGPRRHSRGRADGGALHLWEVGPRRGSWRIAHLEFLTGWRRTVRSFAGATRRGSLR